MGSTGLGGVLGRQCHRHLSGQAGAEGSTGDAGACAPCWALIWKTKQQRSNTALGVSPTHTRTWQQCQEWQSKHEAVSGTSGGSQEAGHVPKCLRVRRDKLRRREQLTIEPQTQE